MRTLRPCPYDSDRFVRMQLSRRKIPQILNEACGACPLEPGIGHSRLQENIGMIHKLDTDWMNGPKNLLPTILSRQSELVNPFPPISGQHLICEDQLKGVPYGCCLGPWLSVDSGHVTCTHGTMLT